MAAADRRRFVGGAPTIPVRGGTDPVRRFFRLYFCLWPLRQTRCVRPGDGSRAFDLRNDRFEVGRADRRRVRAGRRFHLLVYTASPSRRQSVFITDLHGEAFRPPRKTLRFSANKIGTGENPIPIRIIAEARSRSRAMRVCLQPLIVCRIRLRRGCNLRRDYSRRCFFRFSAGRCSHR